LRRDGFVEFPYELGNFSTQIFKTPSGKIELHSSTLANLGLDPLPDYVAPGENASTGCFWRKAAGQGKQCLATDSDK